VLTGAVESYREANDWLSNFLSECCEFDKRYKERAANYTEYASIASVQANISEARRLQGSSRGAGFETRRTNHGVFYYGFRLLSEFLRGARKP
jgi:hypothetical protein